MNAIDLNSKSNIEKKLKENKSNLVKFNSDCILSYCHTSFSLKDLELISINRINALMLIREKNMNSINRNLNRFRSDDCNEFVNESKSVLFDSIIIDLLIKSYYQDHRKNCPGNYDNYVNNSLEIISHFPNSNFFEMKFKNIQKSINMQNLSISKSNKKLILLDLDETLIHTDLELKFSYHSVYIKFFTKEGIKISLPVNIRPYACEFIELISRYYDIAIYTASTKDYADPIIDYIDKKKCIKYRFYREHCVSYKNFQLKSLNIFDKPLKDVLIIENNIFSFSNNLDNGILVTSFYDDFKDIELLNLFDFLIDDVYESFDVRESLFEVFGFSKKVDSLKLKRNNFV